MKLLIFVFVAAVFFPAQAFAYFDAGTGSMLIQLAVGAIAGVSVFGFKIKRNILKWLRKNKTEQNK